MSMTITIFSRPGCQPCRATKNALSKNSINFEEVDITQDEEVAETLRIEGYSQLPVVKAGEEVWTGLRMDKIKELAERLATV